MCSLLCKQKGISVFAWRIEIFIHLPSPLGSSIVHPYFITEIFKIQAGHKTFDCNILKTYFVVIYWLWEIVLFIFRNISSLCSHFGDVISHCSFAELKKQNSTVSIIFHAHIFFSTCINYTSKCWYFCLFSDNVTFFHVWPSVFHQINQEFRQSHFLVRLVYIVLTYDSCPMNR